MSNHYNYFYFYYFFFHIVTVSECSVQTVYGHVGEDVTLPCQYDLNNGLLHVCWGKGEIPNSGCNNEIISTDGVRVTERALERYQLLSDLRMGNVSLTILNSTKADSGIYGCRVQIPGWFNDQKHTVHLIIISTLVPQTTATVLSSWTTDYGTSTQDQHKDNYTQSTTTTRTQRRKLVQTESSYLVVILVTTLLTAVLLTVIPFLIRKRCKRAKHVSEMSQQNENTVYANADANGELNSRHIAMDNIYQLDYNDDYEMPDSVEDRIRGTEIN